MGKAVCVIACLLFFAGNASAQNNTTVKQLRDNIRQLDQRITDLENEVDGMTQVTIPGDLDIYMDEDDPTEPGDIKVVRGTLLELDDCDAATQWSVHSGAGVTLALDNTTLHEGTGSIRVTVPDGITGIIKCTKSAGSWDLTNYKYLSVSLYNSLPQANLNLHFGEAAYNEQNRGVFNFAGGAWETKTWDISAIAAASKNGVTIFALTLPANGIMGLPVYYYIDYVFADPGPSAIRAFDSDRIINLYPKIMTGHYHGTGAGLTVTLARKGTPSAIWLIPLTDAKASVAWQTEFGADSKNLQTSATIANGVTAVGDCYFTVGTNGNINTLNERVSYVVMWDD